MQKKIIALAVAGLVSGVAFAQSNVTVYGIADANFGYSDGDGTKFTGIDSGGWSGSRIGFKGEEALGNGLKAIFTMEFGTKIDSDTALGNTRQAFVGVDTSVGSFTLGRQYAPSFMFYGDNSSNAVTGNYPLNVMVPAFIGGIGGSMTTGDSSRWDNSVAYQSKSWSGFSVRAIYGFGEPGVTVDQDHDGRIGLSGKYNNGALNVDLIYQTIQNQAGTNYDTNEYLVGASYDFKVVKVMGTYQYSKNKLYVGDPRSQVASLGVIVPVSAPGKIRAEVAYGRNKIDNVDTNAKTWGLGLGYTHDLSKRTMLYTSVNYFNNNERAAVGYKDVGTADENNWGFMAGVRHAF